MLQYRWIIHYQLHNYQLNKRYFNHFWLLPVCCGCWYKFHCPWLRALLLHNPDQLLFPMKAIVCPKVTLANDIAFKIFYLIIMPGKCLFHHFKTTQFLEFPPFVFQNRLLLVKSLVNLVIQPVLLPVARWYHQYRSPYKQKPISSLNVSLAPSPIGLMPAVLPASKWHPILYRLHHPCLQICSTPPAPV